MMREEINTRKARIREGLRKGMRAQFAFKPGRFPLHLLRAWPEIALRVRAADFITVLLDFDGTLVNFRPRPGDVRLSAQTRRALEALVRHPNLLLAIISGRKLRILREIISVNGIRCIGLHGAEEAGKSQGMSQRSRKSLLGARRLAGSKLHALPNVWVEGKGLSFAVHYRGAAEASVKAADRILCGILAPVRDALRVLRGNQVWEVVPREILGKGAAVREILDGLPGKTLAVYVGDDDTDESAFAALPDEITARVGRVRGTKAKYYLRNPDEVRQFLLRLEKTLP